MKSYEDFPGTWFPATRKPLPEADIKARFLENPIVRWIIETAEENA
ncbi:MAG: hypothetical protein LBR22_04135 [Desulfovibrio sp.]|nr:hypothetical protein [Desulfovibrio sp.]